jgi:predicted RNase H-like nuclease (RuvC/YqgF family)
LQIRELTQSNLELRKRLEEQSREMNGLKRDLENLQRERAGTKPKSPPKAAPPSR